MPAKDPKLAKNIEELAENLSFERQQVLSLLSERKWFRHTDFEIQKKALILPEDFDGYLMDLAARSEEYGNMSVLKLFDILKGNYNAMSIFEVRSQQNNQIFTYEYTSSKFGRNPGYRGIIFLEIHGEIKYFILRQTEKFALGRSIVETIGGYTQFKNNQLINMPKAIEERIKMELGFKEIVVKRFIDLGQIATDPAVTNALTSLYAAIVDASRAPNLEKLEKKVFHTKPISFRLVIEPIERIREYVHKSDESFFLACVLRLVSMGVIKL